MSDELTDQSETNSTIENEVDNTTKGQDEDDSNPGFSIRKPTPQELQILGGLVFAVVIFVAGFFTANGGDGGNPPDTTQPPGSTTSTTAPPNALEILDNPAGNDLYFTDELVSQADLDDGFENQKYKAFHDPQYTERTSQTSNGRHPQGQARFICSVSHFAYDDPIIFPERPGVSHLHTFFGNTNVDAFTIIPEILSNNGSSTCQTGALNRSAYWFPTLLDGGEGPNRKIVLPKVITLYYKSHRPQDVNPFPIGTQMLAGNLQESGLASTATYTASERLHWGCYNPSMGFATQITNTIPGTNDTPACPNGSDIQATIQFPQCFATDNDRSDGNPILTSDDFQSHTYILFNEQGNYGEQNLPCPDSHPYRTPQISYLIRYANPDGDGERGWRLSSDNGYENETVGFPGMSLHADWFGAWHMETQQAWLDGCFLNQSMNCSLGQTGDNGTNLKARPITGTKLQAQEYVGPQLVDDPSS